MKQIKHLKVIKAAELIAEAAKLLRTSESDANADRNWGLAGSCASYAFSLEELLNSGKEGGIEDLIKIIKRDTK